MVKSKKINVGISIGDPNGIGIEVMLKALYERHSNDNCNYIIYSSYELIVNQKKDLNIKALPIKKIESWEIKLIPDPEERSEKLIPDWYGYMRIDNS